MGIYAKYRIAKAITLCNVEWNTSVHEPLDLMKLLIELVTIKGQVVLDPYVPCYSHFALYD